MRKFERILEFFFSIFAAVLSLVVIVPLSLIAIIIILVEVFGLIIGIFWFAWEWNFLGEQNFLISEYFVVEENIYQKLTELSFTPDVQNQLVFMKLVAPNQHSVKFPIRKKKSELFDLDITWKAIVNKLKPETFLEELVLNNLRGQAKSRIWPLLPPENETLVALADCVVKDQNEWMCNSNISFLEGSTKYIGFSDGNWLTDYTQKAAPYSSHTIFEWKTKWLIESHRCNELCFIDSVEEMERKYDERKRLLDSLLKHKFETRKLPRASDGEKF